MKKTIASLIVVGLFLLAACVPSAPPTATPVPTPTAVPTAVPTATSVPSPTAVPVLEGAEDLIGIWHEMKLAYGKAYLQFREDGTYRVAMGTVARFENRPNVEGEFWFEGKQLLIKDISGAGGWGVCTKPKQITGKYEVQVLADGNLKFAEIEDECLDRALFMPGEYERVP